MDSIDTALLDALTDDARASYRDLGVLVGLSPNAVAARVRRLEAEGVIAGYTVVRGQAAPAQGGLEVFIDIRFDAGTDYLMFKKALPSFKEITLAAHMTGPFDVLVGARVSDTDALDRLLRRLKTECGVAQSQTRVVMKRLD